MADEYIAAIDPAFSLARLPDLAHFADLAVILSASATQIVLRWADTPARQDWPEDIAIAPHAGKLLVQFHTARREQRDALLHRLSCALQQMSGEPAAFEET